MKGFIRATKTISFKDAGLENERTKIIIRCGDVKSYIPGRITQNFIREFENGKVYYIITTNDLSSFAQAMPVVDHSIY